MACGLLLASCAGPKALPPCHESDGEYAYTKDGKERSDGLFLRWQCFDRLMADVNACYGEAKK